MRFGVTAGKAKLVTQGLDERQLPLLVVGHGPRSVPAMQVVEAAAGLCRLLWLVDESIPENASALRLLRRVGTVLNSGGLTTRAVAASVAQYSPSGVVAYRDEDIVPLSLISEELGLGYHAPQVARSLVDKLVQREVLRSGGVPTPGFWEIPGDRDRSAVEALAAISCGSRRC